MSEWVSGCGCRLIDLSLLSLSSHPFLLFLLLFHLPIEGWGHAPLPKQSRSSVRSFFLFEFECEFLGVRSPQPLKNIKQVTTPVFSVASIPNYLWASEMDQVPVIRQARHHMRPISTCRTLLVHHRTHRRCYDTAIRLNGYQFSRRICAYRAA